MTAHTRYPHAGSVALITGASSGIGEAFARELAQRGAHLILVARRADVLDALAEQLRSGDTTVEVVAVDLGTPEGRLELWESIAVRIPTITTVINCAGFGTFGDLAEADPDRIDAEVNLNVAALTTLTTRMLPSLLEHEHAAVLNVASNAAFQPIPHMAVYAATKAYVLSFTQALWGELRSTGVRALAVCPGPTESPFFDVAGEQDALTRRRTPEHVVRTALRALDRGKPSVVDGFDNALVARLGVRLVPERLLLWAAGRFVQPRA